MDNLYISLLHKYLPCNFEQKNLISFSFIIYGTTLKYFIQTKIFKDYNTKNGDPTHGKRLNWMSSCDIWWFPKSQLSFVNSQISQCPMAFALPNPKNQPFLFFNWTRSTSSKKGKKKMLSRVFSRLPFAVSWGEKNSNL